MYYVVGSTCLTFKIQELSSDKNPSSTSERLRAPLYMHSPTAVLSTGERTHTSCAAESLKMLSVAVSAEGARIFGEFKGVLREKVTCA